MRCPLMPLDPFMVFTQALYVSSAGISEPPERAEQVQISATLMGAAVVSTPVAADDGLGTPEVALEAAVVGLVEAWLLLDEHAPTTTANAMVPTNGTAFHLGIICGTLLPQALRIPTRHRSRSG